MDRTEQQKSVDATLGIADGGVESKPQGGLNSEPKFGALKDLGEGLKVFDADAFTDMEAAERKARMQAATKMLMAADVEQMNEAEAGAMYRTVAKAFGAPDEDGWNWFRDRRGATMRDNLKMQRDAVQGWMSGKVDEGLTDPGRATYEKKDEAGKTEMAREKEDTWDKVMSWLKGERGIGFGGWLKAALSAGVLGKRAETTEALAKQLPGTLEGADKEKEEADIRGDFEERMAKNEPLLTLFRAKGAISDRAGWTLTKSLARGNLDVDEVMQLTDKDEREAVIAAYELIRGDKRRVKLLGIETDISTGTAGDTAQKMAYGLQQSLMSLWRDPTQFAMDADQWLFMKSEKDLQTRKDEEEYWRTKSVIEQANEGTLPKGGFFGEMFQTLAENAHWWIPYGIAGWAGKGMKTMNRLKARKVVLEDFNKVKRLRATMRFEDAVLPESRATMLRLMVRYAANEAEARRVWRIAEAADAGYAAMGTVAKMATFGSFAREFVETADASGVSRESSVPLAIAVGLINDRIERINVQGLSENISPGELQAISYAALKKRLQRGEIGKYLKLRLPITTKAGAHVATEEGLIEEPLQQLTIEHFKVLAEDFDGARDKNGNELTEANKKLFADQLNMALDGSDLKTYADTVSDMLPAMVGYQFTTGVREQAENAAHKAGRRLDSALRGILGKAWAKLAQRPYDPAKGYIDHVNERERLKVVAGAYKASQQEEAESQSFVDENGTLHMRVLDEAEEKAKAEGKDQGEGQGEGEATEEEKAMAKQANAMNRGTVIYGRVMELFEQFGRSGQAVDAIMAEYGLPQDLAEQLVDCVYEDAMYAASLDPTMVAGQKMAALPKVTDGTFEAMGGLIKGEVKRDDKLGTVTAKFALGGKNFEVTYATKSAWFVDENGEMDMALFESQLEDKKNGSISDFGVSYNQTNPPVRWEEMSMQERKIALLTQGNGLAGGVVKIKTPEGETVEIPEDAAVTLVGGSVADYAYKVGLPPDVAKEIGQGAQSTMQQVFHETWHKVWRVAKTMISDEDKQALAATLGISTADANWEKYLDEAMAGEFEQVAAGSYVSPVIDTPFKKVQAVLGNLLEKIGVRTAPQRKMINEGGRITLGEEFKLKDFYEAMMAGEMGSANMRIPRVNTQAKAAEEAKAKDEGEGKASVVSKGKLPVAPKEEDDAEEVEAKGEGQGQEKKVEVEGQGQGGKAEVKAEGQGKKIEKAESDWDFGNKLKLRIPNKPGRVVVKLKVVNAFDMLTSFAAGADMTYQNREDTQESKEIRAKIGSNPDYEQAGAIQSMLGGATLVADPNRKMVVGNHRMDGIQQAYKDGKAAAYRARTIAEAEARGLEMDDHALEAPVVIGEIEAIEDNDTLRIEELGEAGNTPTMRGFNVYEEAQNDAKAMEKENVIHGIVTKPDGSIDSSASLPAIKNFITITGAQGVLDDNAVLTEDGRRRLGFAILAQLLSGGANTSALLKKVLAEQKTLDIENEAKGLVASAADLLRLAEERPRYDIRRSLARALEKYTEWREADEAKRAEKDLTEAQWAKKGGYKWQDFAAQQDLFGQLADEETQRIEREAEKFAKMLAESRAQRSFAANGDQTAAGQERAVKYIVERLTKFADNARKVNVETDDLLGGEPASVEDVMGVSFSVAGMKPIKFEGKVVEDAVAKYGTTEKPNETQWILADGRWLKSRGILVRGVEMFGHNYLIGDLKDAIGHKITAKAAAENPDLLDEFGYQEEALDGLAWKALGEAGAIRVSYGGQGLTFLAMPSEKQLDTLWDFIDAMEKQLDEDEMVLVDFADKMGNVRHSKEYNRKTSPRAIIEDVRGLYQDGVVPPGSTYAKTGLGGFSVAPIAWKDIYGGKHVAIRNGKIVLGNRVDTRTSWRAKGKEESAKQRRANRERVVAGDDTFAQVLEVESVYVPGGVVKTMYLGGDWFKKPNAGMMDARTVSEYINGERNDGDNQMLACYLAATGKVRVSAWDKSKAIKQLVRRGTIDSIIAHFKGKVASVLPAYKNDKVDAYIAQQVAYALGVPVGITDATGIVTLEADTGYGTVSAINEVSNGGGHAVVAAAMFANRNGNTNLVSGELEWTDEGPELVKDESGEVRNALGAIMRMYNPNLRTNQVKGMQGGEAAIELFARIPRIVLRELTNEMKEGAVSGVDTGITLLDFLNDVEATRPFVRALEAERAKISAKELHPIASMKYTAERKRVNAKNDGRVISNGKLADILGDEETGKFARYMRMRIDELLRENREDDLFYLQDPTRDLAIALRNKEIADNSVIDGAVGRVVARFVSPEFVDKVMKSVDTSKPVALTIVNVGGMSWLDFKAADAMRNEIWKRGVKVDNHIGQVKALELSGGRIRIAKTEKIKDSHQIIIMQSLYDSGTALSSLLDEMVGKIDFGQVIATSLATGIGGDKIFLTEAELTSAAKNDKLSLVNRIIGYDIKKATAQQAQGLLDSLGSGYGRGVASSVQQGSLRSGHGGQRGVLGVDGAALQAGPWRNSGREGSHYSPGGLSGFSVSHVGRETQIALAPRGEQKRGDTIYPDAGAELRELSFSVGAKRRDAYRKQLEKHRPDLSGEDCEGVLKELDKYDNPKKEKLALHWVVCGSVRLPEDEYKVDLAIKTSEAKGVDPFTFKNPMDIVNRYKKYVPAGKPIDPDTVKELTNRTEVADGIVVYDVDETLVDWNGERRPAGQIAMRKIINTHWGKDARPWCLLRSDENGELNAESLTYWEHYNTLPKRVAFQHGRLLAFMATAEVADMESYAIEDELEENYPDIYREFIDAANNGEADYVEEWLKEHHPSMYSELYDPKRDIPEKWWDRNDDSHDGIPVKGLIPGDKLGRSGTMEYDSHDGTRTIVGDIYRGDENDGVCEYWSSCGELTRRVNHRDGRVVNNIEWYGDGSVWDLQADENGNHARWWSSGKLVLFGRTTEDGVHTTVNYDGSGVPWAVKKRNLKDKGNLLEVEYEFGGLTRCMIGTGDSSAYTYCYEDRGRNHDPELRSWKADDGTQVEIGWFYHNLFIARVSVRDKDGNWLESYMNTKEDEYETLQELAKDHPEFTPYVEQLAQFERDMQERAKAELEEATKFAPSRPNIPPVPGLTDEEIRFSTSGAFMKPSAEGRRNDLVALHNLREDDLRGVLELGGFAMPSVAITKDTIPHTAYGDITFILKPDAVNPQKNAANKIFTGDAFTPSFPHIEYDVNMAAVNEVYRRITTDLQAAGLAGAFAQGFSWYDLSSDQGVSNAINGRKHPGEGYVGNIAVKAAYLYEKHPEVLKKIEVVNGAYGIDTRNDIDAMLFTWDKDYVAWLREVFADIVRDRGFYNGVERFEWDGTRRPWESLHVAVSLSNAVRLMRKEELRGAEDTFGKSFLAVATRELKSFDQVHANEELIVDMLESAFDEINTEINNRFTDMVREYKDCSDSIERNYFEDMDRARDMMLDSFLIARGRKDDLMRELNTYGYHADEEFTDRFIAIMKEASRQPTRYFEAKPMRAVMLNEIAAAVVPGEMDEQLRNQLAAEGVTIYTYRANSPVDRMAAVSSAADDTNSKFSVAPVYTGSAADYTKPSLHYVSTGQGSQVYGWGLYGSGVKGVAENYAERLGKDYLVLKNGEIVSGSDEAAGYVIPHGEKAIMMMLRDADNERRAGDEVAAKRIIDAIPQARRILSIGYYTSSNRMLYEQTFFTNRAPGDESHLLSWYENVNSDTLKRIVNELKSEFGTTKVDGHSGETILKQGNSDWHEGVDVDLLSGLYGKVSGSNLYSSVKQLTGSAKAASEWLAKHDIDGIKYPVNSYGKDVKDGNKVGWNYVSFRDDNIRVDRKWVNGEEAPLDEGESKPGFSVANRKYAWSEYAGLPDRVIHATSHIHLVGHDNPFTHRMYERFKVFHEHAPETARKMAERMTTSMWGNERYLGHYLLGKHYGNLESAKIAVRHHFQPGKYGQLAGMAMDAKKPVRWLYVHNTDKQNTNMIPLAFAEYLAERFGGEVAHEIAKKSDQRNTGASMQARASRNFEWFGMPVGTEQAAYFIVDDVWTTGSTTVSLLEYMHGKGADVRGIVTIATASNGDHIIPTGSDWYKFMHNARMTSMKQVAKVIGFDPEKLTGSEVYAYGVKGAGGKGGLAKWFEMAFGQFEVPDGFFSTPRQMTLSFSTAFPRVAQMPDDDLIVATLAAGMVVNPAQANEGGRMKNGYGFFRKHRKETEALVMKAHPEIANDYGEVTRLAHMLMMRAQIEARDMRRAAESGVSEQAILDRLPKKLAAKYGEVMQGQRHYGGQVMGHGLKAREEVERRWADKIADAVRTQVGVEPELFEQWTGTDFTETLLKALMNPREQREDKPKASEPPSELEVPEELQGAGGEGGAGAQAAELKVEQLDEPRQFAEYLLAQMEKYWREKKGLGEASGARVWSDAVAWQFARKTAQNVFRKLIKSIVYSGSREVALRNIDKFEYARTPTSLIGMMTFAGEIIHARHIRETKQQMLEDLDKFLQSDLGARGRFKADKEELRRKVTAELELRARYMRHAMWLSPEAAQEEATRLEKEEATLVGKYGSAEKDVEQSRKYREIQRQMGILREFGALRYKTLGEIEDAVSYWKAAASDSNAKILQDIRDRELRTMAAADALAAAVVNPKRKNRAESGWKMDVNNYMIGHMGFAAMLQDMVRYADGKTRADAEMIIDYITREVQKAGDQARWEMSRQADAFVKAVEAIYGRPFRKVMAEMNARDERFAPFMGEQGGKQVAPTKGRAMQLLVSLLQGKKPGDDYYDNAVRHNRHKQAPAIAALLTAQDLNMIKWLGQWYEQNRGGLSAVAEALFGMGVYSENANYFPVKMKLDKQGLEAAEGVGWTIFPKALTPRVKNERDFDTTVDIFALWQSRMREAAQWKAHAKLGLELRGIFGRSHLQEAIVANHGAKANRLMLEFITDILAGESPTGMSESGVEKAADWIRGWTALTALGGNVGVTLKQTTSIPAFGFEIGLRKTAQHVVTAFTPAGVEAMAKLWNSTQRQMRWDIGSSEAVANALANRDVSAIKKLFQKSMVTNKIGDVVPGLVVGQGIYRDLLEQGLDDEDAMAETWMLIERTQQSSRMENQPKLQRRVKFGRMLYQFLSTQQQYLQYEMRAVRELAAQPNGKTAAGFLRALALNHFILPSLYFWMGQLYNAMLGQEPPEDQFKDWFVSCMLGPFGSLFVLGFVCQATLQRAVKGYYQLKQADMLPMEGYIKRQVGDAADLIGAIFDNEKGWDEVLEEGLQWLNDVSPTVRDIRKVDKNYIRPEAYPKRRR